jgi:hypothetical protein
MMSQSVALLLSIGIEAAVASAMIGALRWGSPARAALAAAIGTLGTHGLAWWGMLQLMEEMNYALALTIVEAGVVVAESIAYFLIARLPIGRSLAASFVANAASTGFGLALYALDIA